MQRQANLVNRKLREASRGESCTLQVPGVCCLDPERTVGAHLRFFHLAGIGEKVDDLFIIDACDRCHAVLDSRDRWEDGCLGWEDVLRALMISQRRRFRMGLIEVAR